MHRPLHIDFGADSAGVGVSVGVCVTLENQGSPILTKFLWIYNYYITKNGLDIFKVTAEGKLKIHGGVRQHLLYLFTLLNRGAIMPTVSFPLAHEF